MSHHSSDPPDYLPIDTNITISSGTPSGSSLCFTVNIIDDELLEVEEMFKLNLESLSQPLVTVVDRSDILHVTITDNERKTLITIEKRENFS